MTLTHQQKLDAIRLACIAVNPSIKDLVFGCRLLRKGGSEYRCINHIGFGANNKKCWISSVPFGAMPIELEKDLIQNGGEFENIGRDIQLSDVMLAISEKEKLSSRLRSISISGCFYDDGILQARWNLLLPLHLQEPEVIDFIHKLIQ